MLFRSSCRVQVSRDPRYLNAARSYLKEVGRVLAPLQITHGGPIIMAQVENEYGFFGKDAPVAQAMKNWMLGRDFAREIK